MSHFFFDLFNLENNEICIFSGDPGKDVLINILASESVARGQYVLVLSNDSRKYPIEGKVLVCDETTMLMDLIYDGQPCVTYLASNLINDLLIPFDSTDIKTLIEKFKGKTKLFVDYYPVTKSGIDCNNMSDSQLLIECINYGSIKEEIFEIYKKNSFVESSSIDDTVLQMLKKIFIERYPLSCDSSRKSILLITQVSNLAEENIIIPVARKLKRVLNCRIFYGNLNQYHLKEC